MSLPHAVILAGGRGERLGGVRKADLRIGGRRLVERVSAALGPTAAPPMISAGAEPNAAGIPDLASPVRGPLAGLAAAIAALAQSGIREGLLVSVAVDTPFLPAGFAAAMAERLGDAPAAYAAWGEAFYPTNAIWRIAALQDLPRQVMVGEAPASLKALHGALGAKRVDWAASHATDPFANLNTLADLVALGWIARG